jgi:methyl-accepting chemotaxis protein
MMEWVIGGCVAVCLIACWFLSRSITGQINRLVKGMERIAGGEVDSPLEHAAGRNEAARMGAAVEVFRTSMKRVHLLTEQERETEQQRRIEHEAMMQALRQSFGEVVEAATAGDFGRRVPADFADAEINALAGGVNALLATVDRGLRETGEVLSALAETDLTRRMEGDYQGAFGQLAGDTNAVSDTLAEIVGKIRDTSRQLKTATGEILSGANDLSGRTTKQAATVEETNAAMEQLAATVMENAGRAQQASQKARDVTRTATEGGEVMERASAAMERITQSSGKISNIIGLIDDIAFQTNLLALNASVEAARAGEAGKGFAVVAVEVRRLAQSAAQASADVKSLIEVSSGEVTGGTKLVREAASKLEVMLGAAQESSTLIEAIAAASREQAASIEEVSGAVRQLDEMTQHNAALVEETNAAIEQTEAQATELDRIVDVFVLERPEGGRAAA